MVSRRQKRRDGYVAMSVLVFVAFGGSHTVGQTSRRFVARLSTVPITVAMQDSVSGRGAADAMLAGSRLTIDGKFEGLRSPATVARLHVAPRGMRGQAIADLTVSKGTSGVVSGTVELSGQQAQALEKGALYIQIHSEKAPDGNLWGWLLPQEAKR